MPAPCDFLRWITVPRPKPHLDGGLRTFHSVPAAYDLVEGGAIRFRVGIPHTAPFVAIDKSVAIRRRRGTGLRAIPRHGTTGIRVEGHAIRTRIVHTLDDVDSPFPRPSSQARLPDRWPCAAALWNMPHIKAVCRQ